jgi:hypothetical protein
MILACIVVPPIQAWSNPSPNKAPMFQSDNSVDGVVKVEVEDYVVVALRDESATNAVSILSPGEYLVVKIEMDATGTATLHLWHGPKSPLAFFHCSANDIESARETCFVEFHKVGTEEYSIIDASFTSVE